MRHYAHATETKKTTEQARALQAIQGCLISNQVFVVYCSVASQTWPEGDTQHFGAVKQNQTL